MKLDCATCEGIYEPLICSSWIAVQLWNAQPCSRNYWFGASQKVLCRLSKVIWQAIRYLLMSVEELQLTTPGTWANLDHFWQKFRGRTNLILTRIPICNRLQCKTTHLWNFPHPVRPRHLGQHTLMSSLLFGACSTDSLQLEVCKLRTRCQFHPASSTKISGKRIWKGKDFELPFLEMKVNHLLYPILLHTVICKHWT